MATLPLVSPPQSQPAIDWSVTPEKVAELTRRIVATYDPVRVVAFGSWARGEAGPDSDLDLAVIVDNDSAREAAHSLRVDRDDIHMAVDMIIGTVARHQRYAFVAGSIYRAIASEGIVLFDRDAEKRGDDPFYIRPSEEEFLRSKIESIQVLLRKAAIDERSLNLAGMDHEAAGFHGQQAMEKLMKVWLIAVDITPPYIHDMDKLNAELLKKDLRLPALLVDFEKLTEYAAYWRYTELPEERRINLIELQADVIKVRLHIVTELTRLGLNES